MRQAGRYLPDYRRIRERLSFLDLYRNSEAAADVIPMGLGLHFEKDEGPQIERPIRCAEDLNRLPAVLLTLPDRTHEDAHQGLQSNPIRS